MPKSIPNDDAKKQQLQRKTKKPSVPLEMDTRVLPRFQLKCDHPLPLTPHADDTGCCIRWLGTYSSHDLRRPENRDSLITRVNGAPNFYYGKKEYSARNIAYALIRRDFSVLNRSKGHHVRLSSTCGRPWCINPWHHRILPQHPKAKRNISAANVDIMELVSEINDNKNNQLPG